MSSLGSADLQNSAGGNLASQSDQPHGQSVLPPFSEKLSVDEYLILSNEKFKQTIDDFFEDKDVTPLSQLTATPAFPTPHVLAQFALKAYEDYKTGENDAQYERRLALPIGWKLLTTASSGSEANSYFGAAYWHPEHQQVVIAHRGTDLTNLGALWTDLKGMLLNQYVQQMASASTFAHKVVEVLRKVKLEKGVSFQLFFTGHSLGGWLAQITTFTTEYLKIESKFFLRSNNDQDCYHPHTVVFDSPGCTDKLSEMRNTYFARLEHLEHLDCLDITSYLSAPNHINTCNTHLGTVYRIFTDLPDKICQIKCITLCTLATHSMEKIVQVFDPETGQVHKNEQGQLKVQVVKDWPVTTGLMGVEEYNRFFEWAEHLNNYHPLIDETFPYSQIRYQTENYDELVNSLRVFSQEEREFLKGYLMLRQCQKLLKSKELFSVMKDNQAQEKAVKILQSFDIKNDTVQCAVASELRALFPYVKRLLQLFPQIKGIRKRVLQCETRSCIERISKSPLEFNSDASRFREFLESKQQEVLHLRMSEGDEWTALTKVYQLLQKPDFLTERQYTVLKLESLLTLNKFLDISTLRLSDEAPHLMVVACEANQRLGEEKEDMIKTLFSKVKQEPNMKIILTTRSVDGSLSILQHTGREKFGIGFVSRDEQLTWSDLTNSSQEKLLEKSVKFQGAKVSLNELMSAESAVANFLPLGALLEEKELEIADPVQTSNGYDENDYVGRTLLHQKAIKWYIFDPEEIRDSNVYLARTEQEYNELCQQYPNSNVHWLQKDKSGKLIWQQSQGKLETVRRYIDTESSHTYTPDDLDKLLEQAQHQRVMLISDTAGMGKSTLLTHLSKEIKRKFPDKWVVRIDLNDYTNALKTLEQEQINKEKAIEFVSTEVLKLKPGLEMELFKQCCEQKQKLGIVIMLDGFDEISPHYKESVIDLMQALRQTAIEQLWVTTRPHLKVDLEDTLQQLSYTLEPFSGKDQVEFFTKFWNLKDWFTEQEDKDEGKEKKKLEMYAEHLIKKLNYSISKKDSEFTGIPLLTRTLAEAFDNEVKTFYQSAESMPELALELDLVGLYRRFIEKKYELYQEEKLQVNVNKVVAKRQRECDLKTMIEDHQLLGLKVLFTEEQVTLFQKNTECSFSTEDLIRIGVTQLSHDGKPHFIHRNFAEYYVADYLVKHLTMESNTSHQVQNFILTDVFLKKEYKVIRAFIDGLLSSYKPSKEKLKQYGNQIDDLQDVSLIHRAVFEGNAKIIEFLLDSVRAGGHTDTERLLLRERDTDYTTAWFRAAFEGNIQVLNILSEYDEKKEEFGGRLVLQEIWEWAEENLTKEEVRSKLLLETDKLVWTGWRKAANEWEPYELSTLWECSKANLTTEEIKRWRFLYNYHDGETFWHCTAKRGKPDVLRNMWKWAKEYLTTEEIKSELLLATGSDGGTVWQLAANYGTVDISQKIWEMARKNLTKEEIQNMLLTAVSDGKTVWHIAAMGYNLDILQKIWEWAKENLTREEIKTNLLLATDSEGETAWHLAAKVPKLDILQNMWEWANEILTREEIKNGLLLAKDSDGKTIWHLTLASQWQERGVWQKIWEWAKEYLTTEEIKKELLLATDSDGKTIWRWAVERGRGDVHQKMWDWAKENLTREEIKNELLLDRDSEGETVWNFSAGCRVLDFWEWAKENLTTHEIKNELLLVRSSEGETVWHFAAVRSKLDFWEWAKENLTREEIKNNLLLDTDRKGQTAWDRATEWGRLDLLQEIWEWAKKNLTTEEIINKLLFKDGMKLHLWKLFEQWRKLHLLHGIWEWAKENLTTEEIRMLLLGRTVPVETLWYMAIGEGNLDVLQKMWALAKENLTTEEIKMLLLRREMSVETLWYEAMREGNLDVFQKRWGISKENLKTEETKNKLSLVRALDGINIGQLAAQRGKLDVWQKVWEWAKEYLTTEEIQSKVLLPIEIFRGVMWNVSANRDMPDVLQKMWEWAKENVTTEEIKNMLIATDLEGYTALHCAVEIGQIDILQKIWEFAKEKLTEEELKYKLLLATDVDAGTVWQLAAWYSKLDVLQKIWEWAKECLTMDEIKNKLLLVTDIKGVTTWHLAVQRGKLDVLQKIWELAKENLTTEMLKNDLLLATDYEGNTAWHCAVESNQLDILQKIWEWAKEKLTEEELKYKLLLATNDYGNTAWNIAVSDRNLDLSKKIWECAKETLTAEELKINFFSRR